MTEEQSVEALKLLRSMAESLVRLANPLMSAKIDPPSHMAANSAMPPEVVFDPQTGRFRRG